MTAATILLATDLSCRCDRALERAVMLAAEWGARLVVVHVLQEPAPITDLPSWRRPPSPSEAARLRESAARQALADSQAFLATTPAVASPERPIETLRECGDVGALLEDLVHARRIDLVVLGTTGRTGLAHILLGSVARRLLTHLPVDTLVVRRPR